MRNILTKECDFEIANSYNYKKNTVVNFEDETRSHNQVMAPDETQVYFYFS